VNYIFEVPHFLNNWRLLAKNIMAHQRYRQIKIPKKDHQVCAAQLTGVDAK
jgi:hypothetical protein